MSRCSAVFGLVVMLTAPAFADESCLKSHGSKTSLTPSSTSGWWVQGERRDMSFKVTDATWLTTPCPAGATKKVVTGLRVTIEARWLRDRGDGGNWAVQSELPSNVAGDDYFSIQWQGRSRYTLTTMTRGGVSVFAGANPEGENGGNGSWDGVRVTPPSGFESASNNTAARITYVMTFAYTPAPADDCTVQCLPYRGFYMHSYNGDYHILAADAVSVSASFPWSVSVSGTLRLTSEHCWVRQLVDPGGVQHVAFWQPPANGVSRATCCDTPAGSTDVTPPTTAGLVGIPTSASRGTLVSATMALSDAESGVDAVDYVVVTPDGVEVASDRVAFDPPCTAGCDADFEFSIPIGLSASEVLVSAMASDAAGNSTFDEQVVTVSDPLSNPHLSSTAGLHLGRLEAPDDLIIDIFETSGTVVGDVQSRTVVNIVTPAGFIRDIEGSPTYVDQGGFAFRAMLPVAVEQTGTADNGVLSVLNGDRIQVVYRDDSDPNHSDTVSVTTDPNAVYPPADEGREPGCTKFQGLSFGDDVVFAINDEYITLNTTPNETGASVASRLVDAINNAAIQNVVAFFDPPSEVRVAGAGRVALVATDPGIILHACAYCPGDLDGNLVVDLADLALMLSVFGVDAANPSYVFDADIDTNARIELDDLAGLLAVFGASCEPN
ncbi:MAG: hypothetical protein KDA32_10175 [Phycisphaerales bacterium]|nr:hypothetical protein [Phycisphaerales bacterium]